MSKPQGVVRFAKVAVNCYLNRFSHNLMHPSTLGVFLSTYLDVLPRFKAQPLPF